MTTNRKNYSSPLLSLDIYLDYFHKSIKQLKSDLDIANLSKVTEQEVSANIKELIHEEQYDALVITNLNQEIVWVSDGFSEMTGYSRHYAVGKRPNFLQGEGTDKRTKALIRESLSVDSPFSGSILNYKKNGEEYLCQIKLMPVKNCSDEVTHYLALERKLTAA